MNDGAADEFKAEGEAAAVEELAAEAEDTADEAGLVAVAEETVAALALK